MSLDFYKPLVNDLHECILFLHHFQNFSASYNVSRNFIVNQQVAEAPGGSQKSFRTFGNSVIPVLDDSWISTKHSFFLQSHVLLTFRTSFPPSYVSGFTLSRPTE